MKILLLGEFSSLYKNLQEGLKELGHESLIASNGDGWKNLARDISLGDSGTDIFSKAYRKIAPFLKKEKLCGFDVVQYINPFCFYHPLLPNKLLMKSIIEGNNKFFLSAAGDDAYFWKNGRRDLRYGPFEDFLKYDLKKDSYYLSKPRAFSYNQWIVENSKGIIPIMYEYEASYQGNRKLLPTIPIPMNVDKIAYSDNIVSNKLVVFHGLNRYGFKGTRHVEKAFEYLSKKYPNDLELMIAGGLPLNEYLAIMKRANVIIDQTNSYSMGVNGIYAMAMGKVVLGGAEPESIISLGATKTPAINIEPSADSIIEKIEILLDEKHRIKDIGYASRSFAEKIHGHISVANQYVSTWKET